jgi:rSAM/selenodomain-associated transferase 1
MQYAILNPDVAFPERSSYCAMAIMAKAPRAGKVKTRLAPPLTLEQSAALNICFLKDTAEALVEVESASGVICYTPVGDEAAFDGLLPESFMLIAQRGDKFGERLLCATRDILACGYGSVCLIDSDSPTVPAAAFQQAVRELTREGDRIVLGPSHDGGYYLIGLKQAHAKVFENITWSTSSVCEETLERAREAGLEVVMLPLWYDVDDGFTLAMLREELIEGNMPEFAAMSGYGAPHTKQFLATMRETVAV